MNCPCGTGQNYTDCCGKYISGQNVPETPEQLMRSRYTAFTEANVDYIGKTMKSPALDDFDANGTQHWAKKVVWQKLEVMNSSVNNNMGFVEFTAYYSEHNQQFTLHECSEFRLDDGRWYYISGKQKQRQLIAKKLNIGRNDPCHCGSGKKYKKCCDV